MVINEVWIYLPFMGIITNQLVEEYNPIQTIIPKNMPGDGTQTGCIYAFLDGQMKMQDFHGILHLPKPVEYIWDTSQKLKVLFNFWIKFDFLLSRFLLV